MTKYLKWIGLLATLAIAGVLPFYTRWEASQQGHLQEKYYTAAVLDATDHYAKNCVVCHGVAGEGIGDSPALYSEAVQSMSESDLYRVISRGREGTQMAGWAADEGGIFSSAQIDDLVIFTQQANWSYVENRVSELDLVPPNLIQMEVSQDMLQELANLSNGESLGAGLMVYAENCSACHGANGTGTVIAPAVDDPDLRAVPRDNTIQLVSTGVTGTLMSSWEKKLTPSQIGSVVDLIYSWPEIIQAGVEFPETALISLPSSPELISAGDRLFDITCQSCHGVDGYGTPMAPALNNQIFLSDFPDAAIYQVIAGGVPGTLMPAWGSRLADQELQSLIAYLRSWEETAPVILPPVLSD